MRVVPDKFEVGSDQIIEDIISQGEKDKTPNSKQLEKK